MRSILVTGASGVVGYGTLRALRGSHKPLRLIGTSIYDDSVAPAFCDIFEKAPLTAAPNYVEWLKETVRKHEVALVIPGIEADLYKHMEHIDELRNAGVNVLMNDIPLVRLCRDKWAFYGHLTGELQPYAIPTTLEGTYDSLSTAFGLPFLLKPRRGFASQGIVTVNGPDDFAQHHATFGSDLMAQPIVGSIDAEYTTSAFGDGKGGFFCHMTLRRKLAREGFTDRAEVATLAGADAAVAAFCRAFKPVGPTNFQFRVHDGGLKLLEINPRISSSTSIRTAFGYNEAAMAVDFFLEQKAPQQPVIRRGRAVRYSEDHIFYDDRPDR